MARHQPADRGATGLPQQQRRLRVHIDEYFFDCRLVRAVRADQRRHTVEDRAQAARQIGVHGADYAARHVRERVSVLFDDAKA
ncbi:hypothetical protein DFQ30_003025, partial [Apophysomyces sp. BC1015]